MDLYATLGVAKDATKDAIKKAFRAKAKTAHPDAGGKPETFHAIELAHRVLTDDQRREEYDRTGKTDDQPDNTDAQAMSIISAVVDRFLADEQAKFKNLVGEIRKEINGDIATAKRSIDEGRKYEIRTIDLRKRVKGKGASVILAMFDRKLQDCAQAITQLEHQIRVRERALLLLEDTDFEAEKRPPTTFGNISLDSDYIQHMQEAASAQARQRGPFWR